jgi:uncharacterized membrane protein
VSARGASTARTAGRRGGGWLRRRREARGYPLLVSDVTRSWLSLAVFIPLILGSSLAIRFLDLDGFGLTDETLTLASFLVGWIGFSAVYMLLAALAFGRADGRELVAWLRAAPRPRSRGQSLWWAFNGYGAIWWALTGGSVAVFAMTLLVAGGSGSPGVLVWSGVASLAVSWALIAVSFAVHYAREYAQDGGLEFAGEPPRFIDFVYLALQVSTTFASSDVRITSTAIRRSVSMHSTIAFLFNTVIIAILVAVLIALAG